MKNPIEIFSERFCSKCVSKSCTPKGMFYVTDNSSKIPCLLAALFLAEIDRGLLKKK
jgi:hypothetical protein